MAPKTVNLEASTSSTLSLLQSFAATLHPDNASTPPPVTARQPATPEPLELLNTAGSLLKAQTTKLSLLLMNDPFTPSAVQTMLSEISTQSAPAIAAAAQTCSEDAYGKTMRDEARARARRTLVELGHLIQEVQTKASQRTVSSASRDSLATTGVVWAACDALTALKSLGIAGVYLKRASDARGLISDAATELKEWRDDADDEGFESDEDSGPAGAGDAFDSTVFAAAAEDGGASLDRMLSMEHRLPSGRTDLRDLLEEALRCIKLTEMLYAAVSKRRFGTLKEAAVTKENLVSADGAMSALRRMPHLADEMAGQFYMLDADAARAELQKIKTQATTVCDLLKASWTGEEDQFTAWCAKWRAELDSPTRPSPSS